MVTNADLLLYLVRLEAAERHRAAEHWRLARPRLGSGEEQAMPGRMGSKGTEFVSAAHRSALAPRELGSG